MHSLMKIELLFIALVVAVIFSGCASTNSFNKIPTEVSSFQLPKEQLKQQYPDIQEYEKNFRGLNANTPLVQELIDAWGEPDKKKIRISYPLAIGGALLGSAVLFGPVPALVGGAAVIVIRPYAPEYYYWRKENYCIEAYIDKTFDQGYKKRVLSWKWYENNDKTPSPEICKN